MPLNVTFQFDMGSDDLVILETCSSSAATDAPTTEVLSQKVYNCQRSAKKRRGSTATASSDENEEMVLQ